MKSTGIRGVQIWSRVVLATGVILALWLAGGMLAAPPQSQPMKSDQAFKNVQVLKGIPLDDFMGTMGVMTSSLAFDCSDCHVNAGTENADWAADTQRKVIARKMVTMVGNINRENFSGRQVVTCYSCHHGRDKPVTTAPVESVYSPSNAELDDRLIQMPGQPAADKIIDKYLKALGGAAKLAAIQSFVAKGTSYGFGGFGGGADVTLYAKAPNQRTLVIDYSKTPGRGDTTRSFDGQTAWLRTPLNVLGEYQLSGGERDGAQVDAEMSFPGRIKDVLKNLRVGLTATISDLPAPESQSSKEENFGFGNDKLADVVQGDAANGVIVTMYFDHDTSLLLRVNRTVKSPIGRVATLIDYSDYRDVNGVKFPFHVTFAWFNGRDAMKFNEIKTNVAIDPAVFGKPAPLKKAAPGPGF